MINKLIEIKNFGTFNNFKGTQTDFHSLWLKFSYFSAIDL